MGREVRRVPLDFDWPLDEVWQGFLMPEQLHGQTCPACDGCGYSPHARWLQDRWYGYVPFDPSETGSTPYTADTREVREFAERNVTRAPEFYGTDPDAVGSEADRLADLFNEAWSHHLAQQDVDALLAADRLYDFTHTWTRGEGWQPKDPVPTVTAEQVNLWSLDGFGHDALNCYVVVKATCRRDGVAVECDRCDGNTQLEVYPGQRADADAWEPTDPPTGDGWQLWETVSEGSPISPVFASADDLAGWMSDPARGRAWLPPDAAAKFVQAGWAPSLVATYATGVVTGTEFVGYHATETEDQPS